MYYNLLQRYVFWFKYTNYSNKNVCLDGCAPLQILNINGYAFNDIFNLKIYDHCGKEYDLSKLEYAYSLDNLCWSCYMNHKEFSTNTADLIQDFYLRLKIRGIIGNITIDGEKWENYSTQLDSSFKFTIYSSPGYIFRSSSENTCIFAFCIKSV